MEELRLNEMSDDRVLERVEVLVARSNQLTAELLAYLAEVDARGLHLREATGSLFAFCVERLHMSESAAGKRITAARTARKFPAVLAMIASGELHLTAVTLLAPHLTAENSIELLARARHKSVLRRLQAGRPQRSRRSRRVGTRSGSPSARRPTRLSASSRISCPIRCRTAIRQ